MSLRSAKIIALVLGIIIVALLVVLLFVPGKKETRVLRPTGAEFLEEQERERQ